MKFLSTISKPIKRTVIGTLTFLGLVAGAIPTCEYAKKKTDDYIEARVHEQVLEHQKNNVGGFRDEIAQELTRLGYTVSMEDVPKGFAMAYHHSEQMKQFEADVLFMLSDHQRYLHVGLTYDTRNQKWIYFMPRINPISGSLNSYEASIIDTSSWKGYYQYFDVETQQFKYIYEN